MYIPPDANAEGRFDKILTFLEQYKDKYIIAELGISGLNFITFVRGYEDTFMDLYIDRENILKVIYIVYDLETKIIENYYQYEKVDAIGFADDLGTQQALVISTDL
jgi:hypothetical protein